IRHEAVAGDAGRTVAFSVRCEDAAFGKLRFGAGGEQAAEARLGRFAGLKIENIDQAIGLAALTVRIADSEGARQFEGLDLAEAEIAALHPSREAEVGV